MKLVAVKNKVRLLPRNNEARQAIKEFLDMHVACVEVTDYSYKSARCLCHRLGMEINALGVKNIKAAKRDDRVYLVNTLIKED